MVFYDIIIIGGGASGMCTAINAKTYNNKILIIDKDSRPGRKILSTGNGKCNITNDFCEVSLFKCNPERMYPYFSEGKNQFIENVINVFDRDKTWDFFESLGLFLMNRNGYIYPKTEQASSVLEIFEKEIKRLKIDVAESTVIKTIVKENGVFVLDDRFKSENLVLATGGLSSPRNDADRFGYETAKSFGHSLIEPRPALCALPCKGKIFRDIKGVRQDGLAAVYDENGKYIAQSYGNIQFTEYGISGIPVFQLSSIVGKMFAEGRHPVVEIDMFPQMGEKKIEALIKNRSGNYLLGIVNSSLAAGFEKMCTDEGLEKGSPAFIRRLCCLVKHFRTEPECLPPFKNSQVTAGGIPTWEINSATMESKKKKGLYFTGEIIDVNGICGGYNLQWAWSTGYVCAKALRGKYDTNFRY